MKISKKTLLTTGSFFSVAALGLMFVSGAWDNLFSNPDKELEINPSNAIQHFQNVKMIATGNTDDANATISKNGSGTIRIATDDNFVISTREIINDPCDRNGDGIITTGDLTNFQRCLVNRSCPAEYDINNDGTISLIDLTTCTNHALNQNNKITQGVKGSSILGGFANRIKKGIYETILGGYFNAINTGDSNSILGGKYNTIENGTNSVIFGGENNKITGARGENSAIIGSNGNTINISDATIVGNNNTVDGQYSIAMGKKAKVSGKNSFLWSDGRNSELSKNNVFAVIGDNGMVVNSTEAHDIAKLTISGSLVVFDDKNAPECTDETKGVLKVITGDNYNNEQECFCSCDGSGRNALHEGTRCTALCAYGTGLEAECGEVKINCGDNPYSYTGDELSGACAKGELVGGTGAFFVTTNKDGNTLTDYINRSCQVTDGHVSQCYQKLNESCPNINTGYECLGSYENVTGHIIINEEVPTDSASFWTYDPDLKGPCTYKCDQYGEWDPIEEKCTFHSCTGELSEGAQLNDEMVLPMDDNTEYFYDETSTGACAYTCSLESGYRYDPITDKCVPAGCDIAVTEVKDLEVFILSNTGNISHYTMMDRNLGATETFNQDDTSPNEESYGCYFQWGNIHPFNKDRSGSLNTTESLTNTTDYGPNKTNGYYSNPKYYCVSGSADIMYPRDGSNIPIATRFWGGGFTSNGTSYRNGRGTDGTDIDRQGPCPEGYHIPRGSEMESILNEWKDVSEYPTDTGFSDITLQKSKEFASDLLLPFAGYGGFPCSGARTVGLGKRGSYAIGDYYKRKNQLHVGISTHGNGAYLFLNGPAYGYSMRCVKNDISANQKITIHANGGSTAIITIDWETPENGKIITLENPIKTGYSFLGWYLDSTFNTSINEGDDIANNSHLYAKWEYKDCDMEQTVTQDLELFIISSTGEISHYTMMDRNLGAFEVYNQKGESAQNARSYGCHFQWGNNNGFSLGTPSTRYGINPTSYSPSTYSNNKIYCKNRDGSTGDVSELDEDDLNEGGNILGSQYTPINYHLWGGGYILSNRIFRTGYGSNGSNVDRRGPCPEGYHVPGGIEMDDFVNNWNDASSSRGAIGKNFASDLLMPFGRYIEVFCGEQNRFKVGGGIWLSDHIYKNYGGAGGGHYFNHIGKFTDNSAITFSRNGLAHGFPVRCVKNDFSANQKITIHANGGTGAVIGIDWESEGSGKITALSTPSKNGIQFLGWYTDSSFATDSKVTTGDYISNGGDLYAKWDECRIEDTAIQDLDIYILGSTGNTSHYVMMDRNLGATEVYNQDYGSSNQTSFGCYFQWGNNYPFHKTNIAKTQVQANVNGYGPSNYYSRGLFFCNTDDQPNNRFSSEGSDWKDLRGGITNTEISKKGPCPEGYHIPHNTEIQKLINEWKSATTITGGRQLANDMLTPFAGNISPRCDNGYVNDNKAASFWMANAGSSAYNICHLSLGNFTNGEVVSCRTNSAVHAFAVRCVKNDMDTAPQKITIHANGGTGAVISIDWETAENGKIISISEPRKNGTEFQGWYLDEGFTNPIGDYISNGSHLYAKWNECNISDTQVQDLEVFFILSTGDISHYTLMDRNLGAREAYNQNYSSQNEESYGCYFQWGNNYPFNRGRSGASYTTGILTNTKDYGPGTANGYYYNPMRHCSSNGVMYTVDGSNVPFATWFWGGGFTSDGVNYRYDTNPPRGSRGTDGTDIDRQGPCPTGYHVPRGREMESILSGWKEASNYPNESGFTGIELQKSKVFASDLLLPFAGFMGSSCSTDYNSKGTMGGYLIGDYYKRTNHFHIGPRNDKPGVHLVLNGPAHGFSMRCVKNDISANQKVTIHANGGTGAVIAIDWESDGTGKITTLGTPTKGGIQFQGWFSDELLTNPVNAGDYISSGSHLYAKWDECNVEDTVVQDLEVFLLSSTGNITHYTMMDRNLGASEVFNQNTSSASAQNKGSFGCYFQWGNNYGFNRERKGSSNTTETLTDTRSYGPGTQSGYYYNSKRYCNLPGSGDDMYPKDGSSYPIATRLWGGGYTYDGVRYRNDSWGSRGSDGTDEDRQGPCPTGYHVPRGIEMDAIISEWKDISDYPKTESEYSSSIGLQKSKQLASDLLLPLAGVNQTECSGTLYINGNFGSYLIGDYYYRDNPITSSHSVRNHLHIGSSSAGNGVYFYLNGPAHGKSMRCVKNNISANQRITVHANGGTGAVIAIDWETDGTGKIMTLGTPKKGRIQFLGWFSDELLTNPVNTGDYIFSGDHLYAKWNECDVEGTVIQDLDIYILSNTGNTSHYMMMDRNLGAREAYNQNSSSTNEESFGCYFQWGNNFGFNKIGYQRLSGQVDTTSYGPDNYYYSGTFLCNRDESQLGWTTKNLNLWGGVTNTDISKKGPCPTGYHIPSTGEMLNLVNDWKSATNITGDPSVDQFKNDILLPVTRGLSPRCDKGYSDVIHRTFWMADAKRAGCNCACHFIFSGTNVCAENGISTAFPVRCVKNNLTTSPQKITINANGGTGTVIIIDWESDGSGKIITLGTPSKNGSEFLGWYTDEGFTSQVSTGNYISSDAHLYAKWDEDQEFEDLELYFLKDDGNIIHYTMMDRNMGATEIYNQNFDNPNVESFGYHYQWGNNWGFKPCIALGSQCGTFPGGESYTTNERVQKSEWSLNTKSRYVSNVYREIKSSPFNWMADANAVANDESTDMWGGKGDTKTSNGVGTVSDRQGPCPDGYYVPSTLNWGNIIGSWKKSTSDTKDGIKMASDLLLPVAGARDYQSKYVQNQGSFGRYWSSSLRTDENSRAFSLRFASGDILPQQPLNISRGASVRCIKGVTNPQTINIHANGGIKAVIAIDGGKITALGEPSKSGYKFEGWYSDEGLTNPVNTGDYISSGANLYAKWIEATAILLPGTEFNLALRYLSQGPYPTQGDTRVKQILRSENKPQSGEILQTISIEGSNVPVVAWSERDGDNSTIYFYTEAEKIYMNPDSSQMFYPFEGLENVDLSHFDTSIVTDMSSMFQGCRHITELDVSHFDTSNVTNMSHMFSQMFSGEHIIGLDSFDTSKVVNMAAMFYGDRELTELNISGWDTSNVEFMSSMFESCNGLTKLDVSNWNTSKVTNMGNMFASCNSLTGLDVSYWNTSNVTNMYGMFQQCSNLTELDLSNFDTSKVTDMHDMFSSCRNLTNLDVSNWDTSKVTNMYYMFQGLGLTRLDLSSFDTSNVRNMAYMFYCNSNLRTIYASSGFVTTNVTQDQKMFAYSSSTCYPRNLVGGNGTRFDISHNDKSYAKIDKPGQTGYFTELLYTTLLPGNDFNSEIIRLAGSASNITQILYTGNMPAGTNTGIVSVDGFEPVIAGYKDGKIYLTTDAVKIFLNEDSSAMFSGLSNVTKIDTTNRNTSNVTDMRFMFYKCNNLTGLDVSNWKTSNVTSMRNMFRECNSLTELDVSHWKTSNVTDMGYMFNKCYNLESLDVSHWDTSNVTNMSAMFNKCYDLKSLDISDWDTSNVTDMGAMFQHCESLTNLDVSSWDTSNVTDMQYMFFNCSNLTGLDVSNLNTSSVTNMASMFCNCINLTGLDVSNWDTSNVTDMQLMFGGGPDITMNLEYLDVSNWDTHNVTNMEAMFQNCRNLTSLDVSNWNTSNVTYMDHMFGRCNNLRELDVSNWNTSNVTDMKFMFDRCYNLENLDVSHFDTSNVTNMRAMFQHCDNLTDLDLSIWNTNKVINTEYMFADCNNLTTIYASTGFVTTAVTNSDSMFYNDTKLVGGNGTTFSSSHIDKEYAKIDKPGQTGYFTELTYATLLPGEQFNQTIKRLAGQSSATHSTTNTTITQILYTGSMPAGATTGLVSTQGSIPVIAGYLNGTIYLTTEADRIYLNSDSSYMFYDMKGLTKVDFSGWNTSDVTRMSYMFYGCNSLTELDLSNWDTSNVTSMYSMFYNCTGMQTLNMSGWDFSHLPSGRGIYDELYFRNLTNLRSFNLSNAKFSGNMYDAFYNMTNLREINLDGADVSNVVGMNHMFWNCTNLETVSMSGWNTSNVTSMDSMFDGCTRLTGLDLSSWNTSNVTNMLGMFKNCKNLTTIYANTGFITNQVATSTSMFYNDKKLVGGNGTIYDESNTNKTYARIDKPGQKGYFTEK